MNEYGDKIPEDQKAGIMEAVQKLKEAHKSQDLDAIDKAMEELNAKWQQASAEMYKNTQAEQQAGPQDAGQQPGSDNPGGDDGEVTDVDFEEVKDDK